jgi:hypothetical protein
MASDWWSDYSKWLPWGTDWSQAPWGGVQKDARKQMAWMNTMMPWLQAAQQGQQWGTEFDWRKMQDEWNKQFQEGQFGWQKEQDIWGREQSARQLEADKEAQAMATFSRRWKPETRWMG